MPLCDASMQKEKRKKKRKEKREIKRRGIK